MEMRVWSYGEADPLPEFLSGEWVEVVVSGEVLVVGKFVGWSVSGKYARVRLADGTMETFYPKHLRRMA